MKTDKYNDGYQTGLTWDSPWTPGGPFHYTTMSKYPHHIEQAKQSVADWQDWMQGWKDGFAEKEKNTK